MGKQLIIELTNTQYNNILALRSMNMGRVPYKGIVGSAIRAIQNGQEQKTGYWIPDGYRTEEDWINGSISYKCPFCSYSDNYTHRSRYCPDCGAKLKLKKKEVKDE